MTYVILKKLNIKRIFEFASIRIPCLGLTPLFHTIKIYFDRTSKKYNWNLSFKNENGFALIWILFAMPAIVGLVLLTLASQIIVFEYSQKQSKCRDTLMRAQKELAQGLEKLLLMNPQASFLRKEEKALLAAIAIAAVSNPPLVLQLSAQLKINRFKQTTLRSSMEIIKISSEAKANSILMSYDLFINKFAKLHLKLSPPQAIAPDFLPQDQFESKQTLKLSWSFESQWQKYFKKIKKFEGDCESTLTHMERKWTPVIITAR